MGDAYADFEFLTQRGSVNLKEKAIALTKTLKGILDEDVSFEFEASDGRPNGANPDYICFRKENRELARLYWIPDPMLLQVYADDFAGGYISGIQEKFECRVRCAGD